MSPLEGWPGVAKENAVITVKLLCHPANIIAIQLAVTGDCKSTRSTHSTFRHQDIPDGNHVRVIRSQGSLLDAESSLQQRSALLLSPLQTDTTSV